MICDLPPKVVAAAMGRSAQTHLASYSRWCGDDVVDCELLRVLCRDSDWTEELGWVGHGASQIAVSISEHKKNPMATVAAGDGMAVAVLNRNEPAFYCVPAKAYEELIDLVEDLELNRLADARLADGQEPLQVSLAAL